MLYKEDRRKARILEKKGIRKCLYKLTGEKT